MPLHGENSSKDTWPWLSDEDMRFKNYQLPGTGAQHRPNLRTMRLCQNGPVGKTFYIIIMIMIIIIINIIIIYSWWWIISHISYYKWIYDSNNKNTIIIIIIIFIIIIIIIIIKLYQTKATKKNSSACQQPGVIPRSIESSVTCFPCMAARGYVPYLATKKGLAIGTWWNMAHLFRIYLVKSSSKWWFSKATGSIDRELFVSWTPRFSQILRYSMVSCGQDFQ